jgi:phosphatidylglycerol:prolipoprotein diacylglycerol transferase
MLAYYLHDLSPFIFQFSPGFGLRWYGFAYVMAFICGWWLYRWLAQVGYSDLKPEKVGDFISLAAFFGVMLGGRLGWVLFYWLPEKGIRDVLSHPLDFFKVWDGGMASHGGMLGLIIFTWIYARRNHVSWNGIGDNLCVVAPVGLFFGRVANFINGELWGRPSTVPWAVQFPGELDNPPPVEMVRHDPVLRERLQEILPPRHPSQIYEALLEGVLLFTILWLLRTRTKQPRGALTGIFFIVYAIVRIIGECFRVPDSAWHMGPLSAGQFLSLFLIVLGAVFVVVAYRRKEYEARDSAAV